MLFEEIFCFRTNNEIESRTKKEISQGFVLSTHVEAKIRKSIRKLSQRPGILYIMPFIVFSSVIRVIKVCYS